jgi:hypothetical protein
MSLYSWLPVPLFRIYGSGLVVTYVNGNGNVETEVR